MPRIFEKPMWTSSRSGDSAAPAMTAMQSPRRIASAASPIAVVPVEQADTGQKLWPLAPVSMAIVPELASTSPLAMKNGLTARAPLECQISWFEMKRP
jgi:hypothetical protein